MEPNVILQEIQNLISLQSQFNNLETQLSTLKRKYRLEKRKNIKSLDAVELIINKNIENDIDRLSTIKVILSQDVTIAKDFLNRNLTKKDPELIKICFDNIMNHPDEVIYFINGRIQLSKQYKAMVWEKYGEYLYKKLYLGYFGLRTFCHYFCDFITDEHRDTLIKRIIGRRLNYEAKNIISSYENSNTLNFSLIHIQTLEGFLIAQKLKK